MVARLNHVAPVGADALARLSKDNPGWQFETTAEGHLISSPTSSDSGPRGAELLGQLREWNRAVGFGKLFDSSAGLTMPDGAILSPDAACVRGIVWARLTPDERASYAEICPDLCFEIASKSDLWSEVVKKIDTYALHGATYALGIDPRTRRLYSVGTAPASLTLDIDAIIDASE